MARLRHVVLAAFAFWSCGAQNGGWLTTYPPWSEPNTPTYGSPEVWFPILGPLTRHSCFPSRYMAMRVAISHVNRRDGTFCPAIGKLRNNFQLSYELFDSNANGVGAVEALLTPSLKLGNKTKAVLGPNGSGSSMAAANLLTVFGIPQVSWASTSSALSSKVTYPYFSRVVAPDSVTMAMLADWLHTFIGRKANVLHSDSSYSAGQAENFRDAATDVYSMEINSFSFPSSGSGGAPISEANMETLVRRLEAIRQTLCRVVVASALNEEAWDLVHQADVMGMVHGPGWLWTGGDGFAGTQLAGDIARTSAFSGFIYVIPAAGSSRFEAFKQKWAEEMPLTETPEFFQQPICRGGVVCADHPDHNNFNTSGQRDSLQCSGYTGLAYDAAVFMAVVADYLIGDPTSPKHPDELTTSDWARGFEAMQQEENGYECMTGFVLLDEQHDRRMLMSFMNLYNGSLMPRLVLKWSPDTGYVWSVGDVLTWPSGWTGQITNASSPPFTPTGKPPECDAGFQLVDDVCVACSLGEYSVGLLGEGCLLCQSGQYQDSAGSSACIPCNVGTFSNEGEGTCHSCIAGTSTLGRTGEPDCTPCRAGEYQPSEGAAYCQACDSGSTSNPGAISCYNCPPGTSTVGQQGEGTCTSCAPGRFSELEGQGECLDCPVGKFTNVSGQSACTRCGEGAVWSTMQLATDSTGQQVYVPFQGASSQSSCGCAAGAKNDAAGGCEACTEGMTCPGMGVVIIQEGYQSEKEVSIFKCFGGGGTDRCPGGPPGESCALGREGVACWNCEADKTEGDNGECVPCSGTDTLPLLIATICSVVACGFVYYFIDTADRSRQHHSSLIITMIVGQVLTIMQQLSVIGTMNVNWEDPVRNLMQLVQLFAFNIALLRLSCVASTSAVSTYLVKTLMIGVALVVMLIIHVIFSFFWHRASLRHRMPSLIGVVGALLTAFYISIVSVVMGPFQCLEHPNGKSTMRSDMSVICWNSQEPDQPTMMGIGLAALNVPVGFLVWCCYLVKVFPARIRFHDANFMKTYAFLFFRFTAESYWYCLVVMVRGLFIALTPSIPNVVWQLLVLQLVISASLVITIHVKPWRVSWANFIDVLFAIGMMILLSFAALLVDDSVSATSVSWITATMLAGCLASAPLGIGWALWRRFGKKVKPYRFFLCHHKATAGCFCRLLKLMLLETRALKKRKVFLDADDLRNLDSLFDMVRSQVQTLLAVCSKPLLSRPWCVGEIATAKHTELEVLPLRFSDYEPPTEDFLMNYAKYVPDLESLTENGFTMEAIIGAMRWVTGLTGLDFPVQMDFGFYTQLVVRLSSGSYKALRETGGAVVDTEKGSLRMSDSGIDEAHGGASSILLVVDRDHREAFATSLILIEMLAHMGMTDSTLLPALFPDDGQHVGKWSICVCMNGCLQSTRFIRDVLLAWQAQMGLLPIVAEDQFQFPSKEALRELAALDLLREVELIKPGCFTHQDVKSAVGCLFKEIAVFFLPLGAYAVLTVRALDISNRLLTASSTRFRNGDGTSSFTPDASIADVELRWEDAV